MTRRQKWSLFWYSFRHGFDVTTWPNLIRYYGRPEKNPDLIRIVDQWTAAENKRAAKGAK